MQLLYPFILNLTIFYVISASIPESELKMVIIYFH